MRIISAPDLPTPSATDLIPTPYLGALSAYAGACLSGAISLEHMCRALDGPAEPFSPEGGMALRTWIAQVAGLQRPHLNLLTPEPGRMAGLVGPPAALRSALRSAQALVVTNGALAQHTVVADPPRWPDATWLHLSLHPAPTLRPVETLAAHASAAREHLYRSLSDAHEHLQNAGLIPDEPVRSSALPPGWLLMEAPAGMHPTHVHAARLAGRVAVLASHVLSADGGGTPQREVLRTVRDDALHALRASLSYASGAHSLHLEP